MAHEIHWDRLPKAEFSSRVDWTDIGDGVFAATRVNLMIVKRDGAESRLGPPLQSFNVGNGIERTIRIRRQKVSSSSGTIVRSVNSATTEHVLAQMTAKLSSEIGVGTPLASVKIGAEMFAREDMEITEKVEQSLAATQAFSTEETEEEEDALRIGGEAAARADLRMRYWPRTQDFYIHSVEFIRIRVTNGWFRSGRENLESTGVRLLEIPLLSVTSYENQAMLDVCLGEVADPLEDPKAILFGQVSQPMPKETPPPMPSLEEMARIAFPVGRAEKQEAEKYVQTARTRIEGPGPGRGAKSVKKAAAKSPGRGAYGPSGKVTASRTPGKGPAKVGVRTASRKPTAGRKPSTARSASAKRSPRKG
jgi:hypothetical protein